MLTVYIDADGCPVKEQVYKVAARYQLKVFVVANKYLNVPASPLIEAVVVGQHFDEADDWIAERAETGDLVVTADIPLASRCLKNGARVLGSKGREFTEESIGSALASRQVNEHLRNLGVMTGGPAPMAQKDRSRILSKLDDVMSALVREYRD